MARIGRMARLPGARMTGDTVGRDRVANGGADQCAGVGIMTADTRIMRCRGRAYKRIIMAVSTTRSTYRDASMAGIVCMGRLPGVRMTGGTIGRGQVADGGADQRAGSCIMAAYTRVMRFRGCANKRIIMAVSTCGQCYNNARMARIVRMGRLPGTRMTGGTIGRGRVAHSGTDQHAGPCIMTAGTRVMRFRGCTYKCIIMAVST